MSTTSKTWLSMSKEQRLDALFQAAKKTLGKGENGGAKK